MSIQTLNRELVESIRKQARSKSQDDKSKTYQQWLNHLSREYGHSWESLKNHVAELEQTELANLLAEEEERWGKRFLERVFAQKLQAYVTQSSTSLALAAEEAVRIKAEIL